MNFNNQYRIFYFIILLCVPLSILLALVMNLWWWLLASFVWVKILNFVFLQIGLHRYFAHDSFITGPIRHAVLACGSILTGHGSPITWSTHHLYHHRVSDQANDLHSPTHGILHTALLWPIKNDIYFGQERCVGYSPKRLVKDNYYFFFTKTILKYGVF
jgi:stearoyl-CoA desaturase (delta-9 desaturase)